MSEVQKALARQRQLAAKRAPDNGAESTPPAGMFMNPETGQMTSRELMTNALPTSRAGAAAGGFVQGYSLDTADEAAGAIGGEFAREKARSQFDANTRDYPGSELAGRVAGAITSPVNKVLGPVNSVKKGIAAGAAYGGVEGFFSGEGGITERLENAGWGTAAGGLFAGLSSAATKGVSRVVRGAFVRADKRPTVDALKGAKNAAYAAVRRAGVEFDQNDMLALNQRIQRRVSLRDFDEAADPQTAAGVRIFNARKDQPVTLNRLDKLRQNLWDRYARSDEVGLLDMIKEIDSTIERAAEGNELLMAARAANSKYAKAQLFVNAFRKADLQTASTGSGGNILNKYKQAVTRIITSDEARFFSDEEIALMKHFVLGTNAENTLRRLGKLAPGGNGLMQSLMVYGALVDPSTLVIGAAGQAAKTVSDRGATSRAGDILDAVSTGLIPPPPPARNLGPAAVGGAAAGNRLLDR